MTGALQTQIAASSDLEAYWPLEAASVSLSTIVAPVLIPGVV
jgi:hypothetical protein